MAWKTRMLELLLAKLVLVVLVCGADALCPYHMLWVPGSPLKLPDDHPAMQGMARAHQLRRELLTEGGPDAEGARNGTEAVAGAGLCSYTNPITQQKTCVQLVGEAWVIAPDKAEAICTVQGLIPGVTDGVFEAETLCAEFSDDDFAGVCVNGMGSPEERRTPFVSRPGDPSSSCEQLQAVCETFAGGMFVGDGGNCAKIDIPEALSNTSAACQLQPGIAGGGHMHTDSFWDDTCENQDNEYAQPLKWAAVLETVLIQKKSRTIGPVYYDLKNNRKRADWIHQGDETDFFFFGIANATIIHDHGMLYTMNWDTGVCTSSRLPVGNQRASWIIDSMGSGTTSQYLGPAYIWYDGAYRQVKQWRKTEPLENAFMIQSFDEESIWDTPEGPKRRPLLRQTPGSPGQGDSIDIFYNHTTDFDDRIFDVLKGFDCSSPGLGSSDSAVGFIGLNTNSTLEIDSGFVRVECKECDIEYNDITPEERMPAAASEQVNATYFNGTEVIREEAYLELTWEYFPDSDVFSFIFKSEFPGVWLGISFPVFTCAMVPAEGVIGRPAEDGSDPEIAPYKIDVATLSGVVSDEKQGLEDAAFSNVDGMKTLSFMRKANNGGEIVLDPTRPINVNWATGLGAELGYHGVDGRGCLTINGNES